MMRSRVRIVPPLAPTGERGSGTYLFQRTGMRGRAFRERVERWVRRARRADGAAMSRRSRCGYGRWDERGAKRTDRERVLPRDSVAFHECLPDFDECSRLEPGSFADYTQALGRSKRVAGS